MEFTDSSKAALEILESYTYKDSWSTLDLEQVILLQTLAGSYISKTPDSLNIYGIRVGYAASLYSEGKTLTKRLSSQIIMMNIHNSQLNRADPNKIIELQQHFSDSTALVITVTSDPEKPLGYLPNIDNLKTFLQHPDLMVYIKMRGLISTLIIKSKDTPRVNNTQDLDLIVNDFKRRSLISEFETFITSQQLVMDICSRFGIYFYVGDEISKDNLIKANNSFHA